MCTFLIEIIQQFSSLVVVSGGEMDVIGTLNKSIFKIVTVYRYEFLNYTKNTKFNLSKSLF